MLNEEDGTQLWTSVTLAGVSVWCRSGGRGLGCCHSSTCHCRLSHWPARVHCQPESLSHKRSAHVSEPKQCLCCAHRESKVEHAKIMQMSLRARRGPLFPRRCWRGGWAGVASSIWSLVSGHTPRVAAFLNASFTRLARRIASNCKHASILRDAASGGDIDNMTTRKKEEEKKKNNCSTSVLCVTSLAAAPTPRARCPSRRMRARRLRARRQRPASRQETRRSLRRRPTQSFACLAAPCSVSRLEAGRPGPAGHRQAGPACGPCSTSRPCCSAGTGARPPNRRFVFLRGSAKTETGLQASL